MALLPRRTSFALFLALGALAPPPPVPGATPEKVADGLGVPFDEGLLEVLAGFRTRKIPLDVIVQDWFHWKEDAWESHEFDPERFADPPGWVRKIHDEYEARLTLSVWGKFCPGTANFEALRRGGTSTRAPRRRASPTSRWSRASRWGPPLGRRSTI